MKNRNCETKTEIYAEETGYGYDPERGLPYIDIAPREVSKKGSVELPGRRLWFKQPLRVLGDGTAFRIGSLDKGGQRHTWAEALSKRVKGIKVGRVPVEGAKVSARQRMLLVKS